MKTYIVRVKDEHRVEVEGRYDYPDDFILRHLASSSIDTLNNDYEDMGIRCHLTKVYHHHSHDNKTCFVDLTLIFMGNANNIKQVIQSDINNIIRTINSDINMPRYRLDKYTIRAIDDRVQAKLYYSGPNI